MPEWSWPWWAIVLCVLPLAAPHMHVSGGGDAEVFAERTLDAQVDGGGDPSYRGDPRCGRTLAAAAT
jgi:hypothetical protein